VVEAMRGTREEGCGRGDYNEKDENSEMKGFDLMHSVV
jgi:hypothetical protein